MTTKETESADTQRLSEVAPEFERLLVQGSLPKARFSASAIRCETIQLPMRDGIRLATDIYLPPVLPAPVIVVRTPYGRDAEEGAYTAALLAFVRRGYAVVSQDCRGTGDSEPDSWDYYMFESEDGFDCIEWIAAQPWCAGFIGALGGSYTGQTVLPVLNR
jgi:putative CocE/NonD family hydrolase